MAAPLTVHNAEIKTAAVEVRTLTISGKQVTLAVFRQLREEPLIAEDGTLNGVPWGVVNYHPDKCADGSAHWHVVWQRGSELLRSAVLITPRFDVAGSRAAVYDSVEGGVFRTLAVYDWLRVGETPHFACKPFGEIADSDPFQAKRTIESRKVGFFSSRSLSGSSVRVEASDAAVAAATAYVDLRDADGDLAKARAEADQIRAIDGHPPCDWSSRCKACSDCLRLAQENVERCWRRLAGIQEEANAALLALGAECEGFGTTTDEAAAAYADAVEREGERRKRHREVRAAIADLPQLFIAV